MLPKGTSRKKHIDETTRLFYVRVYNARYESIALKILYVMQGL